MNHVGKILDLGWSVLFLSQYSLDFALSDFYLFRSLQNSLNDTNTSQEDQMKMFVENLLSSKASEFYLRGRNKLTDKWQEVIQNNGEYTID